MISDAFYNYFLIKGNKKIVVGQNKGSLTILKQKFKKAYDHLFSSTHLRAMCYEMACPAYLSGKVIKVINLHTSIAFQNLIRNTNFLRLSSESTTELHGTN